MDSLVSRFFWRFNLFAAASMLVALSTRTNTSIALPSAAMQPMAQASASKAATFDHSAFDALLRAHVQRGMVDYDAFGRSAEFTNYLAALGRTDPSSFSRDDQLAFWINAYNAYTIRLITSHQERQSIRNINKTLGFVKAYGPWKEKLAIVGGHAYGLDEIEQDIIRPKFKEPRIHFALVCAAMGCPPLRSEAYVGERLGTQMDDQGRIFLLESPAKNRVDVATRTVYVSPVFIGFHDYIKDFGGSKAAVAKFIARYYPDGPAKKVLESGDFKMVETEYDWTLNSQENARKKP
jgi:hypothetical protein